MPTSSLHFDSLVLFHDPALRLLYHRWLGQHNMHRFRPAVEHVLALLRQHAIEAWVIDLTGLPNVGLEDQIWLSDELVPGVTALSSLRQMAVVLSDNVYNQLATEHLLHHHQHHIHCDVQFFADSAGALDWLTSPASGPGAAAAARMVA